MNRTISTLIGLLVCAPFAGVAPAHATPPTPLIETLAPKIDPAAMAILKKSADRMFALKTFRADCYEMVARQVTEEFKPGASQYALSTLIAAKPNLMRYDHWSVIVPRDATEYKEWKRKSATPEISFVSNGKVHTLQFGRTYRRSGDIEPKYLHTTLEPWGGFYTRDSSPFSMVGYSQKTKGLLEVRMDETQTVDGVPCDVVSYHTTSKYQGEVVDYQTKLFIGRDGIVCRKVETVGFGGKPGATRDAVIRNIVLDVPIKTPRTSFAYTPPEGVESEAKRKAEQPALLANGTPAPDFSATDPDGKPVKLSDLLGKVVVVDFWASWCGPCVASMPHNQKVVAKLQAEGVPVVLLAVDNAEERDAFSAWVKAHPELSSLRFAHADRKANDISRKLYQVSGIPTQYIIDAGGVIHSSSVGFDGETDAMEKAIRAALAAKGDILPK